MRVTLIQAQLAWQQPTANRQYFTQQFDALIGQTDVVVLPEMFTTGFSMDAATLAETMQGETLQWLQQQAQRIQAAIVGSVIISENERYYNRLIWMLPDGEYFFYDKKHLFTLANEHQTYTAGHRLLTVHYKGWKIRPLICYDLRFPAWSRNTDGYDLLLYVANFPHIRQLAWRSLLVARAIENQTYTVGVNVVGTDGKNIEYSGDSTMLDYEGNRLCELSHQPNMITFVLQYSAQQAFRQQFAFLQDADAFSFDKNG
ncbi:MAG: amidohydrolase [Saprospiraceae bacterium]|nr:amidohydrolase [Saprospiraceae bacterium]MBP7679667.1 amidohydrolase [Saprospiraceae bacterium]